MSKSNNITRWVLTIGCAIIIALLLRNVIFTKYIVEGKSMMPTLQDGNRLIVNKMDYNLSKPERFDIIIFHATKHKDFVKRIIGLPGDRIDYQNDVLHVNGRAVKEPFLNENKKKILSGLLTNDFPDEGTIEVPKDKLFVMGDNRLYSFDSRQIGFIDMKNVVGKVNLCYWPYSKFKIVH
nr:signal peptidase I [Terrilactibacillus laevilacticus]